MRSSHSTRPRRSWRDAGLAWQGRRQGRRVAVVSLVVGLLLGLWLWLDRSQWLPDPDESEPMQVTRVEPAPAQAAPETERESTPELPKAQPQSTYGVQRRARQIADAPVSDRAAETEAVQASWAAPAVGSSTLNAPAPPPPPAPVAAPATPPTASKPKPVRAAKPVTVPVAKPAPPPAPPPAQPSTVVGRGPKTFRELNATPVD